MEMMLEIILDSLVDAHPELIDVKSVEDLLNSLSFVVSFLLRWLYGGWFDELAHIYRCGRTGFLPAQEDLHQRS